MNQTEEQAPCGYCCPNCGRDYQSGQRANEALKTMISPDTTDVIKRYREEMMDILSKKERELTKQLSKTMSSSTAQEAGTVEIIGRTYLVRDVKAALAKAGYVAPAPAPAAPGIDLAALRARVVSAVERITSGAASMRIPADMTDPDLVLGDVLCLLDSLGPQTDASPKGGSAGGMAAEVMASEALIRALADYPGRNTHQLQARKVCGGVLALAKSYGSQVQDTPEGGSEARDAALAELIEADNEFDAADAGYHILLHSDDYAFTNGKAQIASDRLDKARTRRANALVQATSAQSHTSDAGVRHD